MTTETPVAAEETTVKDERQEAAGVGVGVGVVDGDGDEVIGVQGSEDDTKIINNSHDTGTEEGENVDETATEIPSSGTKETTEVPNRHSSTGTSTNPGEKGGLDDRSTALTATADDEDSSSYYNQSNVHEDDDEDNDGEEDLLVAPMPLLNYSRIVGSGLPRYAVTSNSTTGPADNGINQRNDDGLNPGTSVPPSSATATATTTTKAGALAVSCTSTAIARVLLDPTPLTETDASGSKTSGPLAGGSTGGGSALLTGVVGTSILGGGGGGAGNVGEAGGMLLSSGAGLSSSREEDDRQRLLRSDLWITQPHWIMAAGLENGNVSLVSVANNGSGIPILVSGQKTLQIREGNASSSTFGTVANTTARTFVPTVDVSFDSTGTILAGIDQGGTCTFWDLKYSASWKPKEEPQAYLQTPPPLPSSSPPSQQQRESSHATDEAADPATAASAAATAQPTQPKSSTTGLTSSSTTTSPSAASNAAAGSGGGMFSSFMSALTGVPPSTAQTSATSPATTGTSPGPPPAGSPPPPPSNSTTPPAIPSSASSQKTASPDIASAASSPARTGTASANAKNFDTVSTNSSPATSSAGPATKKKYIPCLAATITQTSRITYPQNFGSPSCFALDPAHKKRRSEKSLAVGFHDGRLMLTKRGWGGLFQRRNDIVLYHGTNTSTSSTSGSSSNNNNSAGGNNDRMLASSSYRGIECITWRASLLAWADASGIKIMDIETLTRIAHIDRPTGARPTLYPTIQQFKPHLYFETSSKLLVAWGDCLMGMQMKDVLVNAASGAMATTTASGTNVEEHNQPVTTVKRKTVECTMAWELEGVACGLAPLDANHVVILSLVPPEENDELFDSATLPSSTGTVTTATATTATNASAANTSTMIVPQTQKNDLEVQIVSRKDGTIVYCDWLPMLKESLIRQHQQQTGAPERAWGYNLLSSFALPRMDDASEWEEWKSWKGITEGLADLGMNSLFAGAGGGGVGSLPSSPTESRATGSTFNLASNSDGGTGGNTPANADHNVNKRPGSGGARVGANKKKTFCDSHLEWSLESILFDDDNNDDAAAAAAIEDDDDEYNDNDDGDDDDDDVQSIDSDDYGFVLRPIDPAQQEKLDRLNTLFTDDETGATVSSSLTAPVMVVVSSSDVVVARMSDVDDAIEYALHQQGKPALALLRGLQHKRQLRRYKVKELVDSFLQSVLRLEGNTNTSSDAVADATISATAVDTKNQTSTTLVPNRSILSLRRMTLAIESLPILLGGHVDLWQRWAKELESIPGSLFLLRNFLPVRDPILPSTLYERVLNKMLLEIEALTAESSPSSPSPSNNRSSKTPSSFEQQLDDEAATHFLDSLLSWGSTKTLKEYVKLFKYSRDHSKKQQWSKGNNDGTALSPLVSSQVSMMMKSSDAFLKKVETALELRHAQTAAGYLHFPVGNSAGAATVPNPSQPSATISSNLSSRYEAHKDDSQDSLYRIEKVVEWVAARVPMLAQQGELQPANRTQSQAKQRSSPETKIDDYDESYNTVEDVSTLKQNRICLESMARLRMMQNRYDLALQSFLAIGAFHSSISMEDLERTATSTVNGSPNKDTVGSRPVMIGSLSYEHVLGMIEFHHLHQLLLDETFITGSSNSRATLPLFALLRLVGLDLMGNFLMEHCVSPEFSTAGRKAHGNNSRTKGDEVSDDYDDDGGEISRPETLPMDQVAAQLEKSPGLLHWYLHLVFTKKPELYVKFPNNANPPKSVTELHRKHFKLYVEFAGATRDSAKALSGTEMYKVDTISTPLLSFLKSALPLGGVLPIDARRELEVQRGKEGNDDADNDSYEQDGDGAGDRSSISRSFALELAYVIENYSEQTSAEALGVLELYLEGANSLMLAVSYAQRQRQYSSLLWDELMNYCLSSKGPQRQQPNGILFGALLEAAALSGADLARLVARIPPGMVVEGLRPRLVAAVADYRLKLDIHEAATAAADAERVDLLRQVAHRSRRGMRFRSFPNVAIGEATTTRGERKKQNINASTLMATTNDASQTTTVPKTVERPNRHFLSYSIPMR